MNAQAAARLRLLGIAVLVACVLLLAVPPYLGERVKIEYSQAIASTLAIGIALLLFAEIGPLVRSMKAGGVEVEFLDTVSGKFNALEKRVAGLELAQLHRDRDGDGAPAIADKPTPPGLAQPPRYRDDPHKGRFGGQATRDGFTLSATFRNVTATYVEVVLLVEAPADAGIDQAECVEFYLHPTFDPDVIPAVFRDRVAELSILSYGGFTVGAWVACRQVELELDLAEIRGAPRIIRDL